MEIANEMIRFILTSTVLAGIVSATVSLVTNKKNNRLKYITEDRRSWREEIRNIVDELEDAKFDKQTIHKVLQKLKVRINPYGKTDNDIMHDAHIWKNINEIEKIKTYEEFREKKDALVVYLSLLLKYDWERAKKEVIGDKNLFGLIITSISGLAYLSYKHFVELELEYNNMFLFALILLLFVPVAIGDGFWKTMFANGWKSRKKWWKTLGTRFKTILLTVWWMGCLLLLVWLVCDGYNIAMEDTTEGKGYLELTFVAIVMTFMYSFSKNFSTQSIVKKYKDAVAKCLDNKDAK